MTSQWLVWLGRGGIIAALFCGGCAGVTKPNYWPVTTAPSQAAERSLQGVVKNVERISSLSYQERALLTFAANPQNIRDAIGTKDSHGTRAWQVIEIFIVEPGRRVSVLAEEGHDQEALYFNYRPEKRLWYRVKDFAGNSRGVPAVRVSQ
jgi:hypothetical protein